MRRSFKNEGFTLIEMIVVMALMAILLTLSIPQKTGKISKAYIQQSLKLIDDYKPLVVLYYRAQGEMPESNEELGIPEPERIIGNYVTEITLEDGAFHFTFGNKIQEPLKERILTIRPIYVEDSLLSPVSWVCGYDSIPEGMTAGGENLTDIEQQYLPIICL